MLFKLLCQSWTAVLVLCQFCSKHVLDSKGYFRQFNNKKTSQSSVTLYQHNLPILISIWDISLVVPIKYIKIIRPNSVYTLVPSNYPSSLPYSLVFGVACLWRCVCALVWILDTVEFDVSKFDKCRNVLRSVFLG